MGLYSNKMFNLRIYFNRIALTWFLQLNDLVIFSDFDSFTGDAMASEGEDLLNDWAQGLEEVSSLTGWSLWLSLCQPKIGNPHSNREIFWNCRNDSSCRSWEYHKLA